MSTAPKTTTTTTTRDVDHLEEAIQATLERRRSVTTRAAATLGVAPNKMFNLLRHIWVTPKEQEPLTDQEMFQGISLIARYELDPISREVYVTRDKRGRLLTIVGIDGWIRILDRTDHYDGFDVEFGPVNEKGEAEWVETKIFSKKRSHPTVYRAFSVEYAKLGGYVAGIIPLHMLRLFSLRHAARLFVPLGANVVTEDEASWMMSGEIEERSSAKPAQKSKAVALAESMKPAPTEPEEPEPEVDLPDEEPTLADAIASKLAACQETDDVAGVYNEFADSHPGAIKLIDESCRNRLKTLKQGAK